ncbi:MAG: DUF4280 domain-containing protein [Clostridiales bacterium]|nr:DUF4280 domain-containing protein [Clostridiales bacterium]
MGFPVVNGSMCMCSFGAAPCPLVVTSQMQTLGMNMPVATIMDNTPANLPTFGMCTTPSNPAVASATAAALGVLTPAPCVPVFTAPWAPGSPTVLVGNKPALNNSSKLMCAYGGVVSITMSPATTITVP